MAATTSLAVATRNTGSGAVGRRPGALVAGSSLNVPPMSPGDVGSVSGAGPVAPAYASAPLVPQLPETSAALRHLDTFVSAIYARAEFTGVVLLVDNGHIAFSHSYGEADRVRNTPLTATTLFPAGAITKMFTSTLVLQEVEKGHLSLDAPAGRYVQIDSPGVSDVTIRQLLLNVFGHA